MTTPGDLDDPTADQRRVTPPTTALKALAHPVRLRILGLLRLDGPATATQLATRLDLNSGATSYHLRQLELHGFIEDAPDRGNRRDRWWRAAHASTYVGVSTGDEESRRTRDALGQAALVTHTDYAQRAVEERSMLPEEWRKSTVISDYVFRVTPSQANRILGRLEEILEECSREDPSADVAPADAVQWMVQLHTFRRPGMLAPAEPDGDES